MNHGQLANAVLLYRVYTLFVSTAGVPKNTKRRHATCMALAFAVLMPEGVVAYRNHLLLDSLSPIMSNGTKAKKRTIHLTLQVRGPAAIKKSQGSRFVRMLARSERIICGTPARR